MVPDLASDEPRGVSNSAARAPIRRPHSSPTFRRQNRSRRRSGHGPAARRVLRYVHTVRRLAKHDKYWNFINFFVAQSHFFSFFAWALSAVSLPWPWPCRPSLAPFRLASLSSAVRSLHAGGARLRCDCDVVLLVSTHILRLYPYPSPTSIPVLTHSLLDHPDDSPATRKESNRLKWNHFAKG